jgi:hypothetical protein
MLDPVTEEQFQGFWSVLKDSVVTLLSLNPGQYPPVSYERTYSLAYHCVCHNYGPALYEKLLSCVDDHLKNVSAQLQVSRLEDLIPNFSAAWKQYCSAVSSIGPIFNYLNKFYVEMVLCKQLDTDFFASFDKFVLEPVVGSLFVAINKFLSSELLIDPAVMEAAVSALYRLRPDLATAHPVLFQRYIPDVIPRVVANDIPLLAREAEDMLQMLKKAEAQSCEASTDRGLKRSISDCDSEARSKQPTKLHAGPSKR